MIVEVRVPSPGESIRQVQLASWLASDGDYVEKDQEIAELDSDKATLPITAPEAGVLKHEAAQGDTLEVGALLCTLDTRGAAPVRAEAPKAETPPAPAPPPPSATPPAIPPTAGLLHLTPLARKMMEAEGLSEEALIEHLRSYRFSRSDIRELAGQGGMPKPVSPSAPRSIASRETERKKMSTLRLKLSERLVAVKNQTAMLTTFNEVNMSRLLDIKARYNEAFKEKYGVGIGFMSFFGKAVATALQEFPSVNAQIDGEDLLIPGYVDLGIAVSAPKGLVVPVIRNAESLSIWELEKAVKELAAKARNNKISLEEMSGGTFTLTNGGVFGSMMSTPILNPPQSGILGMHNIVERPVAVNGKVEIHPMMYVALSYDHRVIDGRESVSFLVRVKEMIEDPLRMMFGGRDTARALLGLDD